VAASARPREDRSDRQGARPQPRRWRHRRPRL